jgi:hypothetical protein
MCRSSLRGCQIACNSDPFSRPITTPSRPENLR